MFTKLRTELAALLAASLLPAVVLGAPASVIRFDKSSWAQIRQSSPKPAVVVFTTTDCAYCPAVIDALAADLHGSGRPGANLLVVVMDGDGEDQSLLANSHYRRADRLYAFDGEEMALRYSVNPDWRGITPYVALLPAGGEAKFVNGRPADADIRTLLGGH
jgi:hypothetical protein